MAQVWFYPGQIHLDDVKMLLQIFQLEYFPVFMFLMGPFFPLHILAQMPLQYSAYVLVKILRQRVDMVVQFSIIFERRGVKKQIRQSDELQLPGHPIDRSCALSST